METRASYVLVGFFILALFAGLAGFAFWLGRSGVDQNRDTYVIYFDSSVTGLQRGSAVRFQGIPVGTVTNLGIDQADFARVRVVVDLAAGTPIVEGTIAKLALQGVTGGVFINIEAGQVGNPPITVSGVEPYPIIPSEPSSLAAILQSLPSLLEKSAALVDRASAFLSDDNAQALSDTLLHFRTISEVLADEVDDVAGLGASLEGLITNVDNLVVDLRSSTDELAASSEGVLATIDREVVDLSGSVQQLTSTLAGTSEQLSALLVETRPGLRDFTNSGLYEFALTMASVRDLANDLSRIAARIERGGANLLFGDSDQGREIVQ